MQQKDEGRKLTHIPPTPLSLSVPAVASLSAVRTGSSRVSTNTTLALQFSVLSPVLPSDSLHVVLPSGMTPPKNLSALTIALVPSVGGGATAIPLVVSIVDGNGLVVDLPSDLNGGTGIVAGMTAQLVISGMINPASPRAGRVFLRTLRTNRGVSNGVVMATLALLGKVSVFVSSSAPPQMGRWTCSGSERE